MTTIVNNPPANDSGGKMGIIITLIFIVVFAYLFFVFGVPAIRQAQLGSPQINIPNSIDVNIKQTK